jgi:beta-lactamase class A
MDMGNVGVVVSMSEKSTEPVLTKTSSKNAGFLNTATLRLLQLMVVVTLLAFLGMSGSRHFVANAYAGWLSLPPDLLATVTANAPKPAFALQPLPTGQVDMALTEQLTRLCQGYPATVVPYVYVLNMNTGQTASIRGEAPVPAASVIKLPILASLFTRVAIEQPENGLNPNKTVWPFQEIHRASGSGDLQYQKAGQTLTVQQLAEKMIQISDNTATNIILDNLGGMEALNQQWQQWGLTETRLNNWLPDLRGTNTITMHNMAQLLYNINQPEGWLPNDLKQSMKRILLGTVNKRLLVSGVPAGTPVAHKTGDIGVVIGDVGIVRIGDQDVIVCVMAKRPRNHPIGRQLVRDVMAKVYQHMLAAQVKPTTPTTVNTDPGETATQ